MRDPEATPRVLYVSTKRRRVHPGVVASDRVQQGRANVVAPGRTETHFHGRCSNPWVLRDVAQAEDTVLGRAPAGTHDTWVRCRKCTQCLRYRRKVWETRMLAEMAQGGRTWFVTLTVAPEVRYRWQCIAIARSPKPWAELTEDQRWVALWGEFSKEVTLWMKRVRKRAREGSRLRFVLVAEPHADGFPHVHALVHEAAEQVSYRQITQAWRVGFNKARLVDHPGKASRYLGKYLTKHAGARMRASQHYGAWRTAAAASPPEG